MEYKFYAFISYNHKDTTWGKRLQRKLETYRMPSTLCRERGWKKNPPIDPVFFAPTDIQPNDLTKELQERLRASRHLIVICSPNSAQSWHVGQEIKFFDSLGRRENIHLFIIDGIPNSNDAATECFNPVLKELGFPETLGANIHERIYRLAWLNRERALVQIISKLLNVEFDSIWRRHRRRLWQKCVMWAIGVIAVMVAMVVVWNKAQPVDISVNLNEVSTHNEQLPPLTDAQVRLSIKNETKTDTIRKIEDRAAFKNIPQWNIGKEARVEVECRDFLPIDTTIVLGKQVRLDIRRDPKVYGEVRFQLWDPNEEKGVANAQLRVGDYAVTSDAEGWVKLFVPLEKQRASYPVTASMPLHEDTRSISMPCGERVIISLPYKEK